MIFIKQEMINDLNNFSEFTRAKRTIQNKDARNRIMNEPYHCIKSGIKIIYCKTYIWIGRCCFYFLNAHETM